MCGNGILHCVAMAYRTVWQWHTAMCGNGIPQCVAMAYRNVWHATEPQLLVVGWGNSILLLQSDCSNVCEKSVPVGGA